MKARIVVFALFAGVANWVLAADQSGNANIEIVTAITITEDTQIDFGQIINADGTCTMSSGGSLSGTLGMGCTGVETPATFTVLGTSGAVVIINVAGGSTLDGVTYNPVIDGSSARTLSGGSASVDVIGNVVLSGASDGVKDIPYTFTANYQ